MKTLEDAMREFITGVKDGTFCPCCQRYAKVNKVSINKSMAKALEWISKNAEVGGKWVYVQERGPDWMKRSNSHAKMLHWGLLERAETDEDKKHSGVYRPTEKGMKFLAGDIKVRKYMAIYNNINIKPDGIGPLVSFEDCMGESFDYKSMVREATV